MRLRPFIASKDFEIIKNWISDERTHAMWCANLMAYPIKKENFESVMLEAATRFGDSPYVTTTDDGKVVGFFCYSVNLNSNEGMLKFVMVDPKKVELSIYNGIPHLLTPVVTDPKKASMALKRAVSEMERRYDLFEETKTKNIAGYNKLIEEKLKVKETELMTI